MVKYDCKIWIETNIWVADVISLLGKNKEKGENAHYNFAPSRGMF